MKHTLILFYCLTILSGLGYSQNEIPTAEQIRQGLADEIKSFKIAGENIFKIENRTVWTGSDSIKIRIYYPNNNVNNKIVFNIHGGALVACDLDTHDNISRVLANRTNAVVVALDYRKPPEFPYPASVNDCEKILFWIKRNAKSINGNSKNIILIGDSGGGLLITSLAIKLKNKLAVKGICLINPAVDLRNPGEGIYGLVTNWYLNGKSANDSLISPIVANDFTSFPKTLIITCEKDELKPQGIALYEKLRNSGNKVEFLDIANEDHLGGLWAANHPKAKTAIDRTIMFVKSLKD
jgi:acetyl esterase